MYYLGVLLSLLPVAVAEDVLRVLMIGNSYTFYNDLPKVLSVLSRETPCPMKVDSYTMGSMSLRGFLDLPEHAKVRSMLEQGGYDWVVLQDQSQTPAYKPEETIDSVRRWSQLAKSSNTRVMLFLTWAHAVNVAGRLQPLQDMQEMTSCTYCRAAVENGVRVAPVGEAWACWYRRQPDKPLHVQDQSHPNPMGSYLAACVLHSSLSGKPLRGIPGTLKQGRQVVLRIPGSVAVDLQKTSNAALKGFSPEKWLEKQAKKDASRPSVEMVKALLVRGLSISALEQLVGKSLFSSFQQGQRCYQYRLRGGVELCAYCSVQGIVRHVSLAAPGQMVEIIDLDKL